MDDLISRQDAIDMAESVIDGNASAKAWTILARLKTLPSAQPKTAKRTAESEQNVSNGDLILRKAVIEVLDRTQWLIPYAKNVLKDNVRILPSAQPEQRWIPCSERLPHGSYSDLVNVSIHDDSGDTPFDYTSCGWVTTDGEYWIVDNEINNHVVAWMPLPEPWKGEEK